MIKELHPDLISKSFEPKTSEARQKGFLGMDSKDKIGLIPIQPKDGKEKKNLSLDLGTDNLDDIFDISSESDDGKGKQKTSKSKSSCNSHKIVVL